ncbi:Rz-like spanin [Vibrio phage pYD21-A]|uniref:Rz-like spanin n=1 Tax=Vibrio phage pYD21-A TaxID=754049 RepID=UPI0002C0863E|nr:Rz-like spanin [Vibrio phage pYD21-A]AGH16052.1 hypothetical protein VPKG_00015 [Vibrio phage pYD21-A]
MSVALAMTMLLTSCSSTPEIVIKTKYICSGHIIAPSVDELLCRNGYCITQETQRDILMSNKSHEDCVNSE